MKTLATLAALAAGIAVSPVEAQKKAKKPVPQVTYKAVCGMTYTAAEAKKHNYICPMDKKPLKKVVSAAKKPAAKCCPH